MSAWWIWICWVRDVMGAVVRTGKAKTLFRGKVVSGIYLFYFRGLKKGSGAGGDGESVR